MQPWWTSDLKKKKKKNTDPKHLNSSAHVEMYMN